MAPHLLSLPSEIRYQILKYVTRGDEVLACDPRTCTDDYFYGRSPKKISNPHTYLWLICKQISADLALTRVSKPGLRFCKLLCSRLIYYYGMTSNRWRHRVECYIISCDKEELGRFRAEHEFWTFLQGITTLLFASEATYSVEGRFEDPNGVVVTLHP